MKPFLVILISILLYSCGDTEADKLRQKLNTEIVINPTEVSQGYHELLVQNKAIENQFTDKYITDLQNLLDNSFKQQLENFEDKELGVFANIKHMFGYIFMSKQEWEDDLILISNKYFNPLNTETEALNLYTQYNKNIQALRAQVKTKGKNIDNAYTALNIENQKTDLSFLKNHSGTNILIEVGTEIIIWFIISVVLLNILGIKLGKLPGFLLTLVLSFIIGFFFSRYNDGKLLSSIREQHQEKSNTIDFSLLQNKLNKNTNDFYKLYEKN